MSVTLSFQGHHGAYSEQACVHFFEDFIPLPCLTFEEALQAVHDNKADYAVIPIENSVAGRVADVHHLLPTSNLFILAEHFERIEHCLLALPTATFDDIENVHSHVHALAQCRNFIKNHHLSSVVHADTAGAACDVAKRQNIKDTAIASRLSAQKYNLKILAENIEDTHNNTTRFLLMGKTQKIPSLKASQAGDSYITSLIFQTRNVPAALYKALGGFATNGINLLKIESYLFGGNFQDAHFYIDVAGHIDEPGFQHALDELSHFTKKHYILGVYPKSKFRNEKTL